MSLDLGNIRRQADRFRASAGYPLRAALASIATPPKLSPLKYESYCFWSPKRIESKFADIARSFGSSV